MKPPSYIRGLMDIFSSGRRVAIALGIVGLIIALISIAASATSHLNNPYYAGPVVTGNTWLYVGIFLLILAVLAFVGDLRYLAIQERLQEIEGEQRVREAGDSLAESLMATSTTDQNGTERPAPNWAAKDDVLALSELCESAG